MSEVPLQGRESRVWGLDLSVLVLVQRREEARLARRRVLERLLGRGARDVHGVRGVARRCLGQGVGVRVQGLGCRVWGSEVRVKG
jgi:hypothetical protein